MSLTEHYKHKQEEDVIEIRTSDIINFFRKNRRSIIIGGLIGLVIGLLYAFSKPNLYTAQVSVMPEIQTKGSNGLGGLSSLAGLAGINVENLGSQDAIRPDLYPNVLQSVPFALSLLKQPVYSMTIGKQLPLSTYMSEMNKGWLNDFPNSNKSVEEKTNNEIDPQLIEITKEQDDLIKGVQANITATYDKKTGILIISATEPEAVVAATVARHSLNYLTNYITTYRTEKSRRQVNFLHRQVLEAKNRYQLTEYALSNYRDSNRAIYLNTAKIEEQRLQADYLLAQSVYNELSKQMEQAKIKVQEETPVFETLEPASVPLQKSGPKRTVIVLIYITIGVLAATVLQLGRVLLRSNLSPRV